MSIQRWDPWRDIVSLREAMNSLLEESFVRPRAGVTGSGGMALDLREKDDSYIVEATIPGAKPDDVDISVLGDTLRITAEVKDQTENSGEKWLVRERRYGHFERAVTLPTSVKADQAKAEFNDGVLTITLPKAEEARPRSIPVRAGAQSGQQPQEIEVEANGQTNQSPQTDQSDQQVHN